MKIEEYKLLDGRTIRAKYDRLGMCKISQENLEAFVKEFNTSHRQAKILEKIKENYALMKLEERKTDMQEQIKQARAEIEKLKEYGARFEDGFEIHVNKAEVLAILDNLIEGED